MNYLHRLLVFFGLIVLFSCGKQSNESLYEAPVLARAGEHTLGLDDLPASLLDGLSGDDSINVLRDFARQWAKSQAILQQAQKNLSETSQNKDKELEQYLNDLLIYEYHNQLLTRYLDTTVTEEEITEYYIQRPEDFELKENIVQLIFYKLPLSLNNREKLWTAFKRGEDRDLEMLTSVTVNSGGNFFRDDNLWLSFSDILKEIPIVTYNQELFLKNNKLIRLQDEVYEYFVHVRNFKIKNSTSPLDFEQDRIKQVILHQRKKALLSGLEQKIFEDALNKGDVKLMIE